MSRHCKRKNCKLPIYCLEICQKHYTRLNYLRNKDKIKSVSSKYYVENKDKVKKRKKKYYSKNKVSINAKRRKWRTKTKVTRKAKTNAYLQEKRKDTNFLLRERIRTRVYIALKGKKKSLNFNKYIGCSVQFLIAYLELRFKPGMTWDNYGKGHGRWNIDHIKPLSKFNLTDPKQFKKACNYKNLQPMWAIENIIKGNK